ncbi:MAG: prolyl oligopeptidase family serine peptidase [Pseudomonadota bacterium]|jgi:poly(3-hydroxybutyrate) depolymerase
MLLPSKFIARAASCLVVLLAASATAFAQAPGAPAAGAPGPGAPRGGGGFAADPRAQVRSYHFAEAGQDMQYCVFASSKVSKDRPAPLIVSLHGMGAPPTIMCNTTAVDLAEEGGYVLVAPMGYSTTGWFGSPVIRMGPPGARGPGPGPGPGPGATPGQGPGAGAPPPGARPPGPPPAAAAGDGPSDEQIRQWSEQDVMNVLDMMRKEFNIDPRRIYLTGHSMGGAGTLYLGAKHANLWAAIAPVAPASFMMNDDRASILGRLKEAGVPVLLLTGDADEVVSPSNTRLWAETLKEIGAEHVYIEQPGVTHGPVITTSQKEIYEFFGKHRRK